MCKNSRVLRVRLILGYILEGWSHGQEKASKQRKDEGGKKKGGFT